LEICFGGMYGFSESAIKAQQLTDDGWDYIFCGGPFPKAIDISSTLLERMKLEFEYWYVIGLVDLDAMATYNSIMKKCQSPLETFGIFVKQ